MRAALLLGFASLSRDLGGLGQLALAPLLLLDGHEDESAEGSERGEEHGRSDADDQAHRATDTTISLRPRAAARSRVRFLPYYSCARRGFCLACTDTSPRLRWWRQRKKDRVVALRHDPICVTYRAWVPQP